MKKRIILLVTLSLIASLSILLLIPMINYVVTFEEWYSFMTLKKAIATVILLIISVVSSVIAIIFLALNMKKFKSNSVVNISWKEQLLY